MLDENIIVYPVPSSDEVTVTTPILSMNRIEVVDILGKVNTSYFPEGKQKYSFKLNNFSKGAYLLRIHFQSGKISHSRFVVK